MTRKNCTDALGELLSPYARESEADIERWLIEPETPCALAEVMRYCVLSGGKRLRPALVRMSAEAAGADGIDELTRRSAVAVELMHCCSLVHDDLPAMDDDTMRRGRPTAHVRFGEAMAILAGDALLTRAFGVLGEADDPRSASLTTELALGAGASGMVAGQVADMDLCEVAPGLEGLRFVHARKTGAMIRTAARMGAICARAGAPVLAAVTGYAESLGLVFQLVDDVLDVTGGAEELGKTPGKDARSGKRTYVSEVGLDETLNLAERFTRQAVASLEGISGNTAKLAELAELLVRRTR